MPKCVKGRESSQGGGISVFAIIGSRNWVQQLKKPKGHPGKQGGSNIRCFENDRPTQQKSNTGIILGTFSAESDHQKKKWAVMTDQMSSNLIITF